MIYTRASVPPPIAGGGTPPRTATVGYFDGLHVGHQKLLGDLKAWAAETGTEPAVVTFTRHPQELLSGSGPAQILSLEHRVLLLAREGVAATLALEFDLELARWSAAEFVQRAVIAGLNARRLLFGFDSAFGHKRQGTFAFFTREALALAIEVRQSEAEKIAGERVSSTLVRKAVQAGDLSALDRLLGRKLSLLGRVRQGDGRGRQIGFPTANLDVLGSALPPRGVYFAEASVLGGSLEEALSNAGPTRPAEWLGAVVNIGLRPTFKDPAVSAETVEAHLVDWKGDLYGKLVELRFLARHRDEMKFPSAAALVAQIEADVRTFRAGFKR